MNALSLLWQYHAAFTSGLIVTTELVFLAIFIGTFCGAALLWASKAGKAWLQHVVDAFALAISAIPPLVILFWVYYPAQSILAVALSPFATAAVTLSFINTFALYRIYADAVGDLPGQYAMAAKVCGLSSFQTLRYVQFPLFLRIVLPRWIDQQVSILQTSVFASLISVEEIFRAAQRINSQIYQPVLIYTAMAIVFLLTSGSSLYIANVLRGRLYRDFSER